MRSKPQNVWTIPNHKQSSQTWAITETDTRGLAKENITIYYRNWYHKDIQKPSNKAWPVPRTAELTSEEINRIK